MAVVFGFRSQHFALAHWLLGAPTSLHWPEFPDPGPQLSVLTHLILSPGWPALWQTGGWRVFPSRVRLYNVLAASGQRENKNCLQRAKCTNSSQSFQEPGSQKKNKTQVPTNTPLSHLHPSPEQSPASPTALSAGFRPDWGELRTHKTSTSFISS